MHSKPQHKEIEEVVDEFERFCQETYKIYAHCNNVALEINFYGTIRVTRNNDNEVLYIGDNKKTAMEIYIDNRGYHILEKH
jgi:hypothetical protein